MDLKPPVDGLFYEIFVIGTFFRYHNLKNEIDAWETTVQLYVEIGYIDTKNKGPHVLSSSRFLQIT